MHLLITKTKYKGKEKRYAKIVQSYRDGNTSRQKIIKNLGPINSEEDEIKYRNILDSMKKGKEFVNTDNIRAKNAKEYGITYTANKLMEKYGISTILLKELSKNKTEFNVCKIIKALIINRLVKPKSDLSAYEWICNDYVEKIDIQSHHVYRASDYLIAKKEEIEKAIFEELKNKLDLNTSLMHYDLTSSYFEGSNCTIALHGYSRDHRNDREQIVIGLVMCDGIPIFHEVFKGNTVDKSTLDIMAKNLKDVLGVKNVVFVADRGLITEKNLSTLEEKGYQYILGVPRRNNKLAKKLLSKKFTSKKQQSAKEVHSIELEKNNEIFKRRYIVCQDTETLKLRIEQLDKVKKKIESKLIDLQTKFNSSKKKNNNSRDNLISKANKILGKNKRLFNIWFDDGLQFSLNQDAYQYEKKIAGKFLLVSNTNLSASKIMTAYKGLQVVENAFDEVKNFLDVRPIRHYTESRVRAHVFLCVLAFLIESIIEKFSAESARKTLEKLERIKVVDLRINLEQKKLMTELTKEVEEIFCRLKIEKPTSELV